MSLILIGVAAAAKSAGYVSSLPIVGGIIASGIFLLFVAIVGLFGAFKHHQVTLFFYMVVLFAIFVLQFSVACASLAASTEDEMGIIENAWKNLETIDPSSIKDAQNSLNCCGFNNVTDTKPLVTCEAECAQDDPDYSQCETCSEVIKPKVDYGFNSTGTVGLLFAFTEVSFNP